MMATCVRNLPHSICLRIGFARTVARHKLHATRPGIDRCARGHRNPARPDQAIGVHYAIGHNIVGNDRQIAIIGRNIRV